METCSELWLCVDIQCSMGRFLWLMILQPLFPNLEVRWERKTKQRLGPSNASAEWLSLATPRRSVPVSGHFCPGASLSPEECRGGRFGNLPSAQDEWLSTEHTPPLTCSLSPIPSNLPPSHTEDRQKTATGRSLSVHFFSSFLSPPESHYIPQGKCCY